MVGDGTTIGTGGIAGGVEQSTSPRQLSDARSYFTASNSPRLIQIAASVQPFRVEEACNDQRESNNRANQACSADRSQPVFGDRIVQLNIFLVWFGWIKSTAQS
jgi:hypothetical protein